MLVMKEPEVMSIKPMGVYKPGALAPSSGFVQTPGDESEKTVVKGKPFPPTRKPGQIYIYTAVPRRAQSR
jgi:hypothetical protein